MLASRRARARARRSARARGGSRTASRRRRSAAAGRARAARARSRAKPSSSVSEPLRGSMPPTVSTAKRSLDAGARRAPSARSAASRGGRKRRASTPLGTSPASTPNSLAQPLDPRRRDAQHVVGRDDRAVLALDQRRRREVVDVVDGADHVVDHALVAQRQRGVRRQAVLRVDDVVAAAGEERPQARRCRPRASPRCARRTAPRAARGGRSAAARRVGRNSASPGRASATARRRGRGARAPRTTSSACTTPPRGFTE